MNATAVETTTQLQRLINNFVIDATKSQTSDGVKLIHDDYRIRAVRIGMEASFLQQTKDVMEASKSLPRAEKVRDEQGDIAAL